MGVHRLQTLMGEVLVMLANTLWRDFCFGTCGSELVSLSGTET